MRKPPRFDHPVDYLLAEWGQWARRENRSNLGYAQVKYQELISRSQSATTYVDINPAVLALDHLIRSSLAPSLIKIVRFRYVDRMADKWIAKDVGISRPELNRIVNLAILPQLRYVWDLGGVSTKSCLQENVSTDNVKTQ